MESLTKWTKMIEEKVNSLNRRVTALESARKVEKEKKRRKIEPR